MQQQNHENSLLSPSFNSYSSDRLAVIANKVSQEFKADDDEFEFSLVLDASADEIFYQGPVFPIFSRHLFSQSDNRDREIKRRGDDDDNDVSTTVVSLKNLFLEERDPPSSSSSEADELEAIPPGTYCVWKPKIVESSPSTCKKSKSTGSASKRFRIRDFLRRSNSEGKDSFVFLTPKNQKQDKAEEIENLKLRRHSVDSGKVAGKLKAPSSPASSAHELFYVQNRAMKEGDKRKSYLPYRKDLVGFFANVNGLGKPYSKAFP